MTPYRHDTMFQHLTAAQQKTNAAEHQRALYDVEQRAKGRIEAGDVDPAGVQRIDQTEGAGAPYDGRDWAPDWTDTLQDAIDEPRPRNVLRAISAAARAAQRDQKPPTDAATAIVASITDLLVTSAVNHSQREDADVDLAMMLARAHIRAQGDALTLICRGLDRAAQELIAWAEGTEEEAIRLRHRFDENGLGRAATVRMQSLRSVTALGEAADKGRARMWPTATKARGLADELRTEWQNDEWKRCRGEAVPASVRAHMIANTTMNDEDRRRLANAAAALIDDAGRLVQSPIPGNGAISPEMTATEMAAMTSAISRLGEEAEYHDEPRMAAVLQQTAGDDAAIIVSAALPRYNESEPLRTFVIAAAAGAIMWHCHYTATEILLMQGNWAARNGTANRALSWYRSIAEALPHSALPEEQARVICDQVGQQIEALKVIGV